MHHSDFTKKYSTRAHSVIQQPLAVFFFLVQIIYLFCIRIFESLDSLPSILSSKFHGKRKLCCQRKQTAFHKKGSLERENAFFRVFCSSFSPFALLRTYHIAFTLQLWPLSWDADLPCVNGAKPWLAKQKNELLEEGARQQ